MINKEFIRGMVLKPDSVRNQGYNDALLEVYNVMAEYDAHMEAQRKVWIAKKNEILGGRGK